jgi:hypothetical protein
MSRRSQTHEIKTNPLERATTSRFSLNEYNKLPNVHHGFL